MSAVAKKCIIIVLVCCLILGGIITLLLHKSKHQKIVIFPYANLAQGVDATDLKNKPTYKSHHEQQNTYSAEEERAFTKGAKGKLTLRIVDSKGKPVSSASVEVNFAAGGKNNSNVRGVTATDGLFTCEGLSNSDCNIYVNKEGYYRTTRRYSFVGSQNADGVKNGCWQPWNPIIEVVLKENRKPIALYTRYIEKVFPKNEPIGFDCFLADFVEPFGKGQNADFILHYESDVPSRHATLREWAYQTNSLAVVAPTGGFITQKKDLFSCLVSDYEAPLKGYKNTIYCEYKRAGAKIFSDKKINENEYLFFYTRATYGADGEIKYACYGKIYTFGYGECLDVENMAILRISYYCNPIPNDRNLEFDGKNNLFKPDWRDIDWPKEP